MLRRLHRLRTDCRGVAAIEFGMVLPVLCSLVFGLWEVSQGVICYMKVNDVAATVSDLVAQTTSAQNGVGNTDFNNLYIAGKLIMTPESGASLGFAVAEVTFDKNGANPTVKWQVERGGAAAMTSPGNIVSSLGTANGTIIVVEATYTYTSLLDYFITSPIAITSTVYAQSRELSPMPCPPSGSDESCD